MKVNHIQIAYVLGITSLKAKLMMKPYIERFKTKKTDNVNSITSDEYIESSLLGVVFHHPSTELDGKDKIAYTIEKLRSGQNASLKKKIAEDMVCLKAGKIAGKYRPLLYILDKDAISEINELVRKKKAEFLRYGGRFPEKKSRKGIKRFK